VNMRYAIIALSLFLSIPFAQETSAIEDREKAVISALDSIEENVVGFALNGNAKSGMLSSTLSSTALPNNEDVSEYLAFTDFLLGVSVRPSSETKVSIDLRFHKDWQSAYREGNNSPIIRWWSYEGNVLDKKLKFNLGTMRIAYTPLTIYLPEPNLIMEPEIFSNLKKEAMEERYLDGTNRRLMQGLNAEYRMSAGIFDNILLQGTIARLRKIANSEDRIFYDFDPNKERYSTAARIGVETYGFSLGISDVYTFNRLGSTIKTTADTAVDYEKNNVLSFNLNYDRKKLLPSIDFGIGAEYAISNWSHRQDKRIMVVDTILIVDAIYGPVGLPTYTPPPGFNPPSGQNIPPDSVNRYPYYKATSPRPAYRLAEYNSLKGKGALLANAFVSFNDNTFEAKLSGHFLNVNKDFEAELAASPAYLPNLPILNSDANLNSALEQFRTGSLENMYYSLYYSLPMNAINIIRGKDGKRDAIFTEDELVENGYLYNNYKFSQYYRNSYTQQTYTRMERNSVSSRLDPAVNLALPYGYATPDRTGGDVDLNFAWNKAIGLRGVFGMYSSETADYTRFGGGLEVNIANLAGLSKALVVSGSYEQNKEDKGVLNPQVDRVMLGLKVGIWRGLSLSGGFQQISKEFKNPLVIVNDDPDIGIVTLNKTGEVLAIAGPQVKISEKAEFSLQGGLLSNSIEGNGIKLDLDKYIMSGVVTVGF